MKDAEYYRKLFSDEDRIKAIQDAKATKEALEEWNNGACWALTIQQDLRSHRVAFANLLPVQVVALEQLGFKITMRVGDSHKQYKIVVPET